MSTLVPTTDPLTPTPSGAAPSGPASGSPKPRKPPTDAEQRWQLRLLPLMSRMIVGLTIFFFAASMAQLYYLDTRIEKVPVPNLAALGIAADTGGAQPSPELRLLARLDAALLERRYHQANVFLMGRLWTSYLGFVTGMILALVGAVFILGKMREDPTEASGKAPGGVEAALRTSSPGIVLAALGVVLMITTIVTNHPIQTADAPVFIGRTTKPSIDTTSTSATQRESPSDRKP